MMKKLAFFLTVFCTLTSGLAFAQPKTATATLNVTLRPIQTILIGGDNIVNLEYQTKEDSNGVTKTMNDHLIVYSTGGFAVKVKSENENLVRKEGDSKIAVNTINLQASLGTGNESTATTFDKNVKLTNSYASLISSTVGGTDLKFNVAYNGIGNNDYVNKYNNVENPTVYTTTVTYTIEAQ